MSVQSKLLAALGAAAVVFGTFAVTPSHANDEEIEFRCRARAAGGVKLAGRYEERVRRRGTRIKFDAEFEARPGGAYTAGQQIAIFVDSVQVGTVRLALTFGELSGELDLDNRPDGDDTPLPANFPDVGAGSVVEARVNNTTVLGCTLN